MRIAFLSADWANHQYADGGGCTWMRCITVADKLNKIGHEAVVGETGWKDDEGFVAVHPSNRLHANVRGPITNYEMYFGNVDIVVFKLFMWHDCSNLIKRAKALGQTIIIDIDDFFDGLPLDNIAYHSTHKDADPLWNREHMLKSYYEVDGLITSTKFLYDFYKDRNENISIVRNALNFSNFYRRMDFAGFRPTVGWAGILAWRQDDLKELQGALGPFLEDNNLKFHHAGIILDNPYGICPLLGINNERLIGTTGTNPQFYSNILAPIDVGIVPLTSNKFNEAKSSLKGLEYAASGIPFIATPTYEYRLLNEEGAGRLAARKRDWIKHLNALRDPDIRNEEAKKNYDIVFEKYNLDNRVYEWEKVILDIHNSKKS